MIGRYLGTLTPEQEERVLTGKMQPLYPSGRKASGISPEIPDNNCRCLLMTAHDTEHWVLLGGFGDDWKRPGYRYEHLCLRFGADRINAAIRWRVLQNIARRELSGVRETATV